MTILVSSGPSGIDQRRDLPAQRDTGGEVSSTSGTSPRRAPEVEAGLLGVYPYSGADIKLVVHLPSEGQGDGRSARLRELEEELAAYEQALQSTHSEEEIDQAAVRIAALNTVLTSLYMIVDQNQGDDPAAVAIRTAAEADIESTNAQIAELTELVNSGSSRNRADIEDSIRQVTEEIRAEQESSPTGSTSRTKTLAEVQTLSISVHREKYPVRPLGTTYIRSMTRGPRTISGSMVFTTFDRHVMSEFMEAAQYRSTGVGDWDRFTWTSYIMDQIPPLDVSISFANEYGNLSWMTILGVEFVNEGMVMSIEDLFIEGTAQYIARDFDPIRNVANRPLMRNRGVGQTLTGTSIMMQDLSRRIAGRNNPWV